MKSIRINFDTRRLARKHDKIINAVCELASLSTSPEACMRLCNMYGKYFNLEVHTQETVPNSYWAFFRSSFDKLNKGINDLVTAAKPKLSDEAVRLCKTFLAESIHEEVRLLFMLGNDPRSAHVLLNGDRNRGDVWLSHDPILFDKYFEARAHLCNIRETLEKPVTYTPEPEDEKES